MLGLHRAGPEGIFVLALLVEKVWLVARLGEGHYVRPSRILYGGGWFGWSMGITQVTELLRSMTLMLSFCADADLVGFRYTVSRDFAQLS